MTQLGDQISSFGRQARRTISSVLSETKVDKSEIGNLIRKVNSFTSSADYIPLIVNPMNPIVREPMVDLFRDMDLRVKTNYDISRSLSLLRESMSALFAGEIEKLEKDILYMESYISNWNFISGEDDLFNSSFVENFDSDTNSSRYDTTSFPIPDRNRCFF